MMLRGVKINKAHKSPFEGKAEYPDMKRWYPSNTDRFMKGRATGGRASYRNRKGWFEFKKDLKNHRNTRHYQPDAVNAVLNWCSDDDRLDLPEVRSEEELDANIGYYLGLGIPAYAIDMFYSKIECQGVVAPCAPSLRYDTGSAGEVLERMFGSCCAVCPTVTNWDYLARVDGAYLCGKCERMFERRSQAKANHGVEYSIELFLAEILRMKSLQKKVGIVLEKD